MATKKTIMEQAVLDAKQIQEALQANTKEILRTVAREEIDGMVKESLMEDDYEEETIGDEEGETPDEFGGADTDDTAVDIQSSDEVDPEGQDLGMDVDTDVVDTDVDALGGDDLDMTGESDDDVIAIYKKLSGEDQIEIVGDEIHLTVSEPGEYIVKAGGEGPEGIDTEPVADMPIDGELEGGEDEDEMSYEISMDDDEEGEETPDEFGGEEAPEESPEESPEEEGGEEEEEEVELDENKDIPANPEKPEDQPGYIHEDDEEPIEESIPVGTAQAHRLPGKANIGQPKGAGADNLKESTKPSKQIVTEAEVKYKKLLTEATKLKSENEQFRQALKKFRNMLVETVVFNHNLSYVTKLFMEHSTTKEEKARIIKRFDQVTSLKESKKLYKTIVEELGTKKPMNEAVENKIIKEVTTSSSKQLKEATAYVDPSTQRIKDLIKRVENR